MIKERLHALEVVVGSNHQFPGLTKPPHRLGKGICRIPIEACEWLIKQIDIRLLGPCPRKKSALLLPTRKRRNLPVGKILQITNSQCLDNCRIIRRAKSPPISKNRKTPHLDQSPDCDGKIPVHRLTLRHIGDRTLSIGPKKFAIE